MQRYSILPKDADPLLYDPAALAKRKTAPWIADRVFPAVGSMRGAIPPEVGNVEALAKSVKELLSEYGALAGNEAAARASRSREKGNVVHFCRWRQIRYR